VGFAFCRRPRLYIALVHKDKLRVLHHPVHIFRAACHCFENTIALPDILIASPAEVREEEINLCTDRGIAVRPWAARSFASGGSCSSTGIPFVPRGAEHFPEAYAGVQPAARAAGSVDLSYVLTSAEARRLDAYLKQWHSKFDSVPHSHSDLVFNLGDNPEAGWLYWSAPTRNAPRFCMPTLCRSWRVLWLPAFNRWLTVGERLTLMGFPSHPSLAQQYGMSAPYQLPWHIAKQTIGNSMHLANVGVWQAVVAACVIMK
jgi:hypothetical protein